MFVLTFVVVFGNTAIDCKTKTCFVLNLQNYFIFLRFCLLLVFLVVGSEFPFVCNCNLFIPLILFLFLGNYFKIFWGLMIFAHPFFSRCEFLFLLLFYDLHSRYVWNRKKLSNTEQSLIFLMMFFFLFVLTQRLEV